VFRVTSEEEARCFPELPEVPEVVAGDTELLFGVVVAPPVVVADAVDQDRCWHWRQPPPTRRLAATLGFVAVETAAIETVATVVAVVVG
jgi:hypothetical protein